MEEETALEKRRTVGRIDKNNNLWIPINVLNPYLICGICQGYLYEACTITECMHSFCKDCIVKHLVRSLNCPVCAIVIHPTDPFVHIRFDGLLQDIVYVLLPHVKKNEYEREKSFYKQHEGDLDLRGKELVTENQAFNAKTAELTGQLLSRTSTYIPPVSLCLQYLKAAEDDGYSLPKHFVQVTGSATIKSLTSFLRLKLDLKEKYKVEFYYPGKSGFVFLGKAHTLKAIKDLYNHDKDILHLKYDITEQCEEV